VFDYAPSSVRIGKSGAKSRIIIDEATMTTSGAHNIPSP